MSASSRATLSPHRCSHFEPHHLVGTVVLYGLALDSAVRFLHWLWLSLIHEFIQ
jgi:hypothetical protein